MKEMACHSTSAFYITRRNKCQSRNGTLIPHQGIICGVTFDPSSLRRIAPYASVVVPRRLASHTLLVIRNTP
jgi:hypothetical protein